MSEKKSSGKIIVQNRKAHHDYFIEDTYEAGISLSGTEVKSIRAGQVNLKDSYCSIKNGELFVYGMQSRSAPHAKTSSAQTRDTEAVRTDRQTGIYACANRSALFRRKRKGNRCTLQR